MEMKNYVHCKNLIKLAKIPSNKNRTSYFQMSFVISYQVRFSYIISTSFQASSPSISPLQNWSRKIASSRTRNCLCLIDFLSKLKPSIPYIERFDKFNNSQASVPLYYPTKKELVSCPLSSYPIEFYLNSPKSGFFSVAIFERPNSKQLIKNADSVENFLSLFCNRLLPPTNSFLNTSLFLLYIYIYTYDTPTR